MLAPDTSASWTFFSCVRGGEEARGKGRAVRKSQRIRYGGNDGETMSTEQPTHLGGIESGESEQAHHFLLLAFLGGHFRGILGL